MNVKGLNNWKDFVSCLPRVFFLMEVISEAASGNDLLYFASSTVGFAAAGIFCVLFFCIREGAYYKLYTYLLGNSRDAFYESAIMIAGIIVWCCQDSASIYMLVTYVTLLAIRFCNVFWPMPKPQGGKA